MSKLKILIEGYAKKTELGHLASSSTVLIEDNNKKIIVDPGANRSLLIQKLQEENISLEDINYVFLTHYHIDHSLLMGIFPKAKILDDSIIYDNDLETDYSGFIPETSVQVISTPGHDLFHASLVVDTDKGKYVVAGDVFWWSEKDEFKVNSRQELLDKEDPYMKDKGALNESRKKILDIADFIIPGYGQVFKNPK